MMSRISSIWKVMVREAHRMSSRRTYMLMTIVFPLLTILFFALMFKEGVPTKMPIAIVDYDNTVTSRKFARMIDVTPASEVIESLQSESEALSELRKGRIYGFVVLPKDLQSDILASRQPVISYCYHNSFLVVGGLMQNDLTLILRTLLAGVSIQKREAMGQSDDQIIPQVQPVQLNTHQLFNPMANYSVYISTIVLPIMLQLFILLMTVYSVGIEIKEKTSRLWLRKADKSVIAALAGKLLPYTVIFFSIMMFQNFILYKVLQIPMLTGIGWLMLSSLLLVLAYQALGILFIGMFPLLRHALNMAGFYGILALTLCGFSFPTQSMSPVFQSWATCFPVRHFMYIFHNQVLAGFEAKYSLLSYLFFLLFLLLPFLVLNRLKSALIYQNFIEKSQSGYLAELSN